MPNDTMTRWTVSVSKDTDISVRSFLVQRGMKKGDFVQIHRGCRQMAHPGPGHG